MAFSIPNEASATFEDQAEPDSVDFDILVAGHAQSGVVSGCAVTAQASPDMTVAVAAGTVSVGGTYASVTSGNVTIGTANATNPRFDLVTVNSSGTKAVTAGTAAANAVFPAIPANSVVLAAVYVPANDTAINSTQIIDKRVVVTPPKLSNLSDVNTTGLSAYDALIWDGSSWVMFNGWTSYTPSLTATTTNPTLGTGSTAVGRWARLGDFLIVKGVIVFGTSGTNAGSGDYLLSLPFTCSTSGGNHVGTATLWDNSAGHATATFPVEVYTGGASLRITYATAYPNGTSNAVTHSQPWAWAASDQIKFHVMVQVA